MECVSIKMDALKGLIYRVSREIFFSAKDRLDLFLYGYPLKYSDNNVLYLSRSLDVLKRIDIALLNGEEPCLTGAQFEKLSANLNRILARKVDKCDLRMLVSNRNKFAWELAHPYCISRKRWEELAYMVCGNLSMDFKTTDLSCNFLFDLSSKSLSCDIVSALSVHQQLCDYGFTAKRTDKECAADFDILLEKHPDCGLSFRDYKNLINCNMSFNLVDKVYCDNASFIWRNGTPYLKTLVGEYEIGGDFTFTQVLTPGQCASEVCRNDCSVDTGDFYKKLLEDYNLTPEQKANILTKIYK